ncbi:uncharacterized protein PRCAT00005176001 [Priceomyces carsonii]|uniref:uncharacterized protein n=1 Tax=Priceomyces carsonii TaxID=28549 RepID=UPI002ED9C4C6|nr:unnamed protein product [Priceomyces carsonii]
MSFKIRVAYIPEHFSTPLFLAEKQEYYKSKGLEIEFIPVLEGTGRLIKLLNDNEVDIAIGLTEGFIADIAKGNEAYKVVGSYVTSPLCWAISTGYNRDKINKPEDLAGDRIGVSRIGSGSYIMSFVLGLQLKLPEPYFSDFPVLSNFKNLRDSVNRKLSDDLNSDAFMWEYFTSKKYYDNKEIKKIGEIYTPWPSWVIAAKREILDLNIAEVKSFLESIRKGMKFFLENKDASVSHIATNLDYTEEDAQEWLKTVKFNESVGETEIDWKSVVENTADVLKKAGVLTDDDNTIQKRLEKGVVKVL